MSVTPGGRVQPPAEGTGDSRSRDPDSSLCQRLEPCRHLCFYSWLRLGHARNSYRGAAVPTEAVAKVRLPLPHSTAGATGEAAQDPPGCGSNRALGEGTASANQLWPQQQYTPRPRCAGHTGCYPGHRTPLN